MHQQFISAIQAAGLVPPSEIIPDGKIHRFSTTGRPKDNTGWYVYFDGEIPGGAFGCWRELPSQTWHANIGRELSQQERDQYKQRMEEAAKLREIERAKAEHEAKIEAAEVWKQSIPAQPDHPYLIAKRVKPYKLRQHKNYLVVPMYRGHRDMASIQKIYPDGTKHFLPGTQFGEGLYAAIGERVTTHIIICEGWATGASIHEATGMMVVVAFNASNLVKVASSMAKRMPTAKFIIAADNDQFTTKQDGTPWNPGLEYGRQAAHIVGGKFTYPEFDDELETKPTDFNDLHALRGLEEVNFQVMDSPTPALEPIKPDDMPDADDKIHAVDVFSRVEVPAITPDMLPEVIAAYAFDQAELIGVHAGMIAIPALVACASVIDDGIQIQPKRYEQGWRESARLWVAMIGDPSIKKSASLSRAIKPVKGLNAKLHEKNERAKASHLAELDSWKVQCANAKQTGVDKPQAPQEPAMLRTMVEDVTVEKMSHILKDNPRGILCVRDELSGWFGGMNAYSGKAQGKDEAKWLELYNGGSAFIDRVTTDSIYVKNWSSCMAGGIQPDIIRGIANKISADGLLQRFMVIIGANQPEQDRPENTAARHAYNDLVERLFSIAPSDQPVTLSDGAHEVRERLNSTIANMLKFESWPTGFKSHLAKWQGLFPRLLLTYHVIECSNSGKYPSDIQVSENTAKRVAKLMMKFLFPNAASFYLDMLNEGSFATHVKWIAAHILSKRLSVISTRDIAQSYIKWRSLQPWERTRILNSLIELGWITPDNSKETQYKVNQSVHETYADVGEKERENRKELREIYQKMKLKSSEFDAEN